MRGNCTILVLRILYISDYKQTDGWTNEPAGGRTDGRTEKRREEGRGGLTNKPVDRRTP